VGEVPESRIYVERKVEAAEKLGIDCSVLNLPSSISEKSLVNLNLTNLTWFPQEKAIYTCSFILA